jgi:hypothetical protein
MLYLLEIVVNGTVLNILNLTYFQELVREDNVSEYVFPNVALIIAIFAFGLQTFTIPFFQFLCSNDQLLKFLGSRLYFSHCHEHNLIQFFLNFK